MVKALPPIEVSASLRTKLVSGLITIVRLVVIVFLIVSGLTVILQYSQVMLGTHPSDIEKMRLDYSMSVFAGTVLFLLIYQFKFEDIVHDIFNVKRVKPLDKKYAKGDQMFKN